MIKIFSPAYIEENRGCYTKERLQSCSFMRSSEITIGGIVDSEIPLKDKYWFIANKANLSPVEKVQIGLSISEIILPVYETGFPNNPAPREALNAAKEYLKGAISKHDLRDKVHAACLATQESGISASAGFAVFRVACFVVPAWRGDIYVPALAAIAAAYWFDTTTTSSPSYSEKLLKCLREFTALN